MVVVGGGRRGGGQGSARSLVNVLCPNGQFVLPVRPAGRPASPHNPICPMTPRPPLLCCAVPLALARQSHTPRLHRHFRTPSPTHIAQTQRAHVASCCICTTHACGTAARSSPPAPKRPRPNPCPPPQTCAHGAQHSRMHVVAQPCNPAATSPAIVTCGLVMSTTP